MKYKTETEALADEKILEQIKEINDGFKVLSHNIDLLLSLQHDFITEFQKRLSGIVKSYQEVEIVDEENGPFSKIVGTAILSNIGFSYLFNGLASFQEGHKEHIEQIENASSDKERAASKED